MTNSGAMRHVVRIEQRSTVQDDNGEESPTWSLVATRRAEMLATPGAEIWSSKERSARVPTVFKMRFPKTFTVEPQMRLVFKGRIFDITSAIDADGREVDLIVSCQELVGEPIS